MQTIIASGGTIGLPLAKELSKHTNLLRLVCRYPEKVNESVEVYPLDIQDYNKPVN